MELNMYMLAKPDPTVGVVSYTSVNQPIVVLRLSQRGSRVILTLSPETAREVATAILDALTDDDVLAIIDADELIGDGGPVAEIPLVCDHCGGPAKIVDGYYKHIDPSETESGTGWYGCSHVAGSFYAGLHCTVNGSDVSVVKTEPVAPTTSYSVGEAVADTTTGPVCDYCGEPVESDGDDGNEWWQHVDRNLGRYDHTNDSGTWVARVTVNGYRAVQVLA